jgi:hypothetical protein
MKTVNARDLQKKINGMCGYVPTGPGCHHASWQACRRDRRRRGEGLGGRRASDLFNLWKFSEERRKEPTVSMKELRTRLKKEKK